MKYASVCSGVEAATLAWMPLGWKAAWFSEIEPFPCEVLKQRFPGVPNLGDMTKIKVENLENGDQRFTNGAGTDVVVPGGVDLLVGGTPCQGFSVAGKQGGLQDDRSVLCLTFCKLLADMHPKWFVWENVPGVFSTGGGEDFKAFIRAIDEVGYHVAWRVLDAQYVRVDGFPRAVPQRRRRVFVIGHLGGWEYPAEVLFEPSSMSWDSPPRRIKGKGFTANAERCVKNASGFRGIDLYNQKFTNDVSMPITAARSDPHHVPSVMKSTFWNGDNVSTTLTEEFSDDRMPDKGKLPCVVEQEVICRATQQGNAETMFDACPTITEAAGTSGNNQPIICLNDQGGSVMQVEQNGNAGTLRANTHGNEQIVCVHGAETPICNAEHSNPVTCNHNGLGNVVCWAACGFGQKVESDVSATISTDHDDRVTGNNAALIQERIGYYPSQNQVPKESETPTLTTDNCSGIRGDTPLVQECYAIDSMASNSMKSSNPNSGFHRTEISKTLDTTEPTPTKNQGWNVIVESVAIAENIIGRKVENGGNGTGAQEELAYTQNTSGVMGVANHATVRRLLPVECERLMGFPMINVLEIGKMTNDEFIAWELAQKNISVDIYSGKVFSHRTGGGNYCEPHELQGTILNGYKVVSLREKEIKKQCRVHRIVWIAAHGIIPENMTVDHINNDKLDNSISNLQLLSAIDNSLKAHNDGLVPHATKISNTDISRIVTLHEEHEIPIRKLASMFGISKSRVHQLIKSHGWTQIPWKGKSAEECPDSPRYKACGNSMCVNVMRWIGMRIENVERKVKRCGR